MPVHTGKDSKGMYVQYGNQTRYYFNPYSHKSFSIAHSKALNQAAAIFANGYRDKHQ